MGFTIWYIKIFLIIKKFQFSSCNTIITTYLKYEIHRPCTETEKIQRESLFGQNSNSDMFWRLYSFVSQHIYFKPLIPWCINFFHLPLILFNKVFFFIIKTYSDPINFNTSTSFHLVKQTHPCIHKYKCTDFLIYTAIVYHLHLS